MSSTHSIGAMNQLADAFDKEGWSPEDVTKLRQSNLKFIRDYLYGRAAIVPVVQSGLEPVEHLINCDVYPIATDRLRILKHSKNGQLKWEPNKVTFYLAEKQKKGGGVEGYRIYKELKDMPVLNANVLDYLLANQHLIPEEWKCKYVFFWGTIYRDCTDDCVRFLRWGNGVWEWRYRALGCYDWSNLDPAALLLAR